MKMKVAKCNIDIPMHLKKVRNNKLWLAAAVELHRLVEPYTPMKEGILSKKVTKKPKKIIYDSSHAHYQYQGKAMGPVRPITKGGEVVGFFSPKDKRKTYNGKKLVYSTERHPKATDHWGDEAMKHEKQKLIDFIQKSIDSGRFK